MEKCVVIMIRQALDTVNLKTFNLLLLIQCGEPSLKQRQSEDLRASRSE
jgi:hypothetical protein